jgi:hypothetical protein
LAPPTPRISTPEAADAPFGNANPRPTFAPTNGTRGIGVANAHLTPARVSNMSPVFWPHIAATDVLLQEPCCRLRPRSSHSGIQLSVSL